MLGATLVLFGLLGAGAVARRHADDDDASSSVVSLLNPSMALVGNEASVVGADAAATTYAMDIDCDGSYSHQICDVMDEIDSITVTQGPKTYHVSVSVSDVMVEEGCAITGTTEAQCSLTLSGGPIETTSSYSVGSYGMVYHDVTITAGAENLEGAATRTGSPGAAPRVTDAARNLAVGGAAAVVAVIVAHV